MERRRHGRWEGRIAVDLEHPSGIIFEATGLNIGAEGMCLIFPDVLEPTVGAVYSVGLRLPTLAEPIANAIVVRWVDPVRPKLCGVSFTRGLRPIEAFTLNELIAVDPD